MSNLSVNFLEGVQIIVLAWAAWLIYRNRRQFLTAVYLFIIRLPKRINRAGFGVIGAIGYIIYRINKRKKPKDD